MSLEEINQRMAQYVARRNATPQTDFEGLSPNQMRALMYDPFGSESPLKWCADQHEEAIAQVPLLVLLDLLMAEIQRTGDIFFPKRWMDATLSGYQSPEAAAIVTKYLEQVPREYPERLRRVILSSADDLFRAADKR